MSIDYDQLKLFVKEAMFTGGGINEPSAPVGVPHRMPAADTRTREQDKGDPKANKLYEVALTAREATEELVEALDDPTYDDAYEWAFKASAALRRVLNSIENSGAYPMADQRVVAPPVFQQKYNAGRNAGNYGGGLGGLVAMPASMGEGEEVHLAKRGGISKSAQVKGEKERAASIAAGDILGGVDNKERAILVDIEKVLTKVADQDDLVKFRPMLQSFLKQLLKRVDTKNAPEVSDIGAEL